MKGSMVASALLLVAACGVAQGPHPPAGDYKLYEATSTQQSARLAVIDSTSRATDRTLPLGTPSPDWQHLYSVSGARLVDSDPVSGTTLGTLRLPGAYQLPPASISGLPGGLSQDGRWLTLESLDRNASSVPTSTHMLVISTTLRDAPKQVDLAGNFAFDAISNDGRRLYLIEYMGGGGYRVRVYDVGLGLLDPNVVVDKSDGSDSMAGVRLMGVYSPGGQWQYSVYARQNDGAFIHALNLTGNVSACIFLPGPGYASSAGAMRWSLALSPHGDVLYATNAALGYVTEVNVGDSTWPSLARTVRIPAPGPVSSAPTQTVQAKEPGASTAVLSPDGRTLVTAGATGVVWLDTADLAVRKQALEGWQVWSLGVSPDGQVLYAVDGAGMIAQLSMSSGAVAARFNPGAGRPMGLMRVAAPGL